MKVKIVVRTHDFVPSKVVNEKRMPDEECPSDPSRFDCNQPKATCRLARWPPRTAAFCPWKIVRLIRYVAVEAVIAEMVPIKVTIRVVMASVMVISTILYLQWMWGTCKILITTWMYYKPTIRRCVICVPSMPM